MLQIKDLTITHKKDLRTILENFSLTLNAGDKAVIIGEEGNGKSTLLKLIFDEKLVRDYVEYSGEIIKSRLHFGYLAQELTEEQKANSIFTYCSKIPGFLDQAPKELAKIAFSLGFDPSLLYSDQTIATLSGGEKVKLQLAGIFMTQPDVLLLDEPSNDIDLDTLKWLENFINSCNLPILFVSHDETLIENTANVIIHLEQLRRKTTPHYTIAKMSYREYKKRRSTKLSHQEQMAKKEESEYRKQQEKLTQIQSKVEHQQNTISRADAHGGRLLKKKMRAVKSMGKRMEKSHQNNTQSPDIEEAIMLHFDKDITLPSGKTVLNFTLDQLHINERILAQNIKLNIIGPQKICITGKNGIGKTTLLKLIAQDLINRKDLNVAYMPQNYEDLLDFSKTPVEFLAKTHEKKELTKIRSFLGSVKYTTDEMDHQIAEMSGGQKAKLLFLKMILDGCNVLILDEPTRNFSPLSNPVIRSILKSYGGAIISISHDRKYIEEVCDQVYQLTESGLLLS